MEIYSYHPTTYISLYRPYPSFRPSFNYLFRRRSPSFRAHHHYYCYCYRFCWCCYSGSPCVRIRLQNVVQIPGLCSGMLSLFMSRFVSIGQSVMSLPVIFFCFALHPARWRLNNLIVQVYRGSIITPCSTYKTFTPTQFILTQPP